MAASAPKKGSRMDFSGAVDETINPKEETPETVPQTETKPEDKKESKPPKEADSKKNSTNKNTKKQKEKVSDQQPSVKGEKKDTPKSADEAPAQAKENVPEETALTEPKEDAKSVVVQSGNLSLHVEIKAPVEEETYCVRKQVVLKPSVAAKLEKILKERKISFNSVVNQFLEAFVDDTIH